MSSALSTDRLWPLGLIGLDEYNKNGEHAAGDFFNSPNREIECPLYL
jgi:hypothetical protein